MSHISSLKNWCSELKSSNHILKNDFTYSKDKSQLFPPIGNHNGHPFRRVFLMYEIQGVQTSVFIIDLVTVFDAILTSRRTREKLQCLYENLISNNFPRTAFQKNI